MSKIDPFTAKRITVIVERIRSKSGQLPTIKDFEAEGIDRKTIDRAVLENILDQFYVTLTNGTLVKTYKVKS